MHSSSPSLLSMLGLDTYPSTKEAQDAPTVAVMAVGGTIGLDAAAWVEASDAIEARRREAGYASTTVAVRAPGNVGRA